MPSPPEGGTFRSPDWRRPLRYLWRIPFLVLHLGVALPFTVLMINPLSARIELRGERLDHRIIEERSLVVRRNLDVRIVWRERFTRR